MFRASRSRRPELIVLVLVLLLCLAAGKVHSTWVHTHGSDPVLGTLRDVLLTPAQTFTAGIGRWCSVHLGSMWRGPALAEQNTRLQAQILTLQTENAQMAALRAENDRLRSLLAFQKVSPVQLLPAQVLALKPSPLTDTLTLSAGLSRHVFAHSVVIAANGGLVGQVVDASSNSSTVLLMTDPQSSVGAQVAGRGAAPPVGLCQGDLSSELKLTYLQTNADVRVGDKIVTAGLGGVFSKGVPIGTVTAVTYDKTRSIRVATVHPETDFDHLQEAFVRQ